MAVDKQANYGIVHQNGFGKANRLAGQALDPRSQGQMLALNPLRVSFTDGVLFCFQEPQVCAPGIGIKLLNTEGRQAVHEGLKRLVFMGCQDRPVRPQCDGQRRATAIAVAA